MGRSKYEIIQALMQELGMAGDVVLEIDNRTDRPIFVNIDKQEIGRYKLVIRDNDDEYVSPSVYRMRVNSSLTVKFEVSHSDNK